MDAIYRETIDEIKQYQREGIYTVELESAALFTLAKYRNILLASVFCISDSLADLKWKPGWHSKDSLENLKKIFSISSDVLKNS